MNESLRRRFLGPWKDHRRIKASGADAVIALGGGSVMDAAKVASLCARHNKAAREFVGIGKAGGRGLPTVLIPTTAGTGSEATFVALAYSGF